MESQSHIVFEGWLTKSPPEKRIWKTKWRRRWFVLKLSGQIPGQYVLEYYADSTRKKLKGKIDLDQCEQVDAGLQLESRKENFQHMFDVRTSKRTYYLVAKSEIEMNKWVECICSVCGLKIHVEEGADDRYSPQPSQEFAFSANNSNSSTNSISTTSTITIPQNQTSENACLTSFSRVLTTQIEGPSGPYIPISECHTGKPINGSVADLDNVPQLPTKITRAVSDDCYDIPRQLNPLTDSNEENRAPVDLLNKVPKAPISANNTINNKMLRNSVDSALANPPKVNWSTYPRDSVDSFNPNDVTRTSVRSCNASVDTSVTTRHCSVNDSGFDTQRSSSPLSSEFSRDSTISNDSNAVPPPRPPKPPSLRKSKSKSESCASLPNVSSFYDVPVTAVEQNLKPDEEVSPTSKVPLSASVSDNSPKSPDELYDFPRMHSDSITVNDNERESLLINTAVPIALDRSTLKSSKKHSYTNAPPGYFVNKETVFNYEYRPTLVSSLEDNSISLQNKFNSNELESSQAERSPLTPNSATYNNLPISSSLPNSLSSGPPAVNRDLKPRRKGSDSDASSTALPSPTMKTATIQLQPPPALTRIHSAPTKRSFRKPRASAQSHVTINGTPPRIPSRSLQYQHNREPSTSEDDVSLCGNGSRRNSANDEQTPGKATVVPPPRRHFEGSEIQYLDLDLDSDSNSQSPRTPNEHNHQRSNSTLSNKELSTNNSQTQPIVSSGSTVYKTVDFLKTEAFNKMRLNVETYRNSQ